MTLKILILNDSHNWKTRKSESIHIDFYNNLKNIDFDLIVHAGDHIQWNAAMLEKSFFNLRELAKDRPVLTVRGNHDFWQIPKGRKGFLELFDWQNSTAEKYNIKLLDNGDFFEDGNVFIGGFFSWYAKDFVVDPENKKSKTDGSDGADRLWIGERTEKGTLVSDFLRGREKDTLSKLIEELELRREKIRIVVSHMVPISLGPLAEYMTTDLNNWDKLKGKCDHYIFGHLHKLYEGELKEDIRLWQSGSRSDKPRYLVLEI